MFNTFIIGYSNRPLLKALILLLKLVCVLFIKTKPSNFLDCFCWWSLWTRLHWVPSLTKTSRQRFFTDYIYLINFQDFLPSSAAVFKSCVEFHSFINFIRKFHNLMFDIFIHLSVKWPKWSVESTAPCLTPGSIIQFWFSPCTLYIHSCLSFPLLSELVLVKYIFIPHCFL